jgi:hypothetical protein
MAANPHPYRSLAQSQLPNLNPPPPLSLFSIAFFPANTIFIYIKMTLTRPILLLSVTPTVFCMIWPEAFYLSCTVLYAWVLFRCPYKTSPHKTSPGTKRHLYKTSPHKTSPHKTSPHKTSPGTKRHLAQNITCHKASPATKHHLTLR